MILGLDPSLRNFGWTLITDEGAIIDKGMMKTAPKTIFIQRYIYLRDGLREIIQRVRAEHPTEILRAGIESPIFNDLYSEGMYGLFLYSNEALMSEKVDTVFLTPNQIKSHAALFLNRPKGWKMQKADMVVAAKQASRSTKRWNHHQADAYWVGRIAGRFWSLIYGEITEEELSPLEITQFTIIEKYKRGKKAGTIKRRGITYKEEDRFFRWSSL